LSSEVDDLLQDYPITVTITTTTTVSQPLYRTTCISRTPS